MIELLTEGNEFVVINPSQIVYIKEDEGACIIKLTTNEQFIFDDYIEVVHRLIESDMPVYQDRERREALEEAVPESEAE